MFVVGYILDISVFIGSIMRFMGPMLRSVGYIGANLQKISVICHILCHFFEILCFITFPALILSY